MDTEGIAYDTRDGSYWLGEEYGPSILAVAADGTLLMRITPKGLGLAMNGVAVRELLPNVYMMRKPNRGFEGIAISPDGSRLFVMLQSPLLNPDKKTGEMHPRSPELLDKIADQVQERGLEAWWELDPKQLLGGEAEQYEKTNDIMDVWFDSGCVHQCVAKYWPEITAPADLYSEGSDQHRGWFQSSLLT